jgi:hypothetical protein
MAMRTVSEIHQHYYFGNNSAKQTIEPKPKARLTEAPEALQKFMGQKVRIKSV